jgi:two-component sensor histidine kinase
VPCGLIISELISNALKYAFPGGRKGKVSIGMGVTGDGSVALKVADNGIGLPADLDIAAAGSLGLQIVNILTSQLRGRIDLHREGGTRITITFPLPENRS